MFTNKYAGFVITSLVNLCTSKVAIKLHTNNKKVQLRHKRTFLLNGHDTLSL